MNNKLNIWKILFLLFLAVATIYIIRNNNEKQSREKAAKNWQKTDAKGNTYSSSTIDGNYICNKGSVFGTYYNIIYRSQNDLHEKIRERLQAVDNSLSPFNPNSIISAINNNREVTLDKMFMDIFNLAQKISAETDGAFDITVAPLVNAWGFGFKNGTTPDSIKVDSIKRFIGYKSVAHVNGRIVKQHPETMLDCSAIAKGYGSDVAAALLKEHGVSDFMVEIGGEVCSSGHNNKRKKWRIGINKPIDDPAAINQELYTIIELSGKSIATSGNYRNYRKENGRKIAHTIDPRTGFPANHSLLSATVIADDCATADAYATAFMVMGVEEAAKAAEANNSIECCFIYAGSDGSLKTQMTTGFANYIVK